MFAADAGLKPTPANVFIYYYSRAKKCQLLSFEVRSFHRAPSKCERTYRNAQPLMAQLILLLPLRLILARYPHLSLCFCNNKKRKREKKQDTEKRGRDERKQKHVGNVEWFFLVFPRNHVFIMNSKYSLQHQKTLDSIYSI